MQSRALAQVIALICSAPVNLAPEVKVFPSSVEIEVSSGIGPLSEYPPLARMQKVALLQ